MVDVMNFWKRFSAKEQGEITKAQQENKISIALQTINKSKKHFALKLTVDRKNKYYPRTYISIDALDNLKKEDALELMLMSIKELGVEAKELELNSDIYDDRKQKLQNKIIEKKNKIERLHEINKAYVEHKAEHDNLYVTESDNLFLEFMEVSIDEFKDLSDKLAELDRYYNNLDITVQEHDDKINEMYVEKER